MLRANKESSELGGHKIWWSCTKFTANDRRLTQGFKAPWHHRYRLWAAWDRINCPVLVLRGADSDLLLPRTAREMLRRNELARLEIIQGCGHAPALMNEQQIALVSEWISAPLPEEIKVA